MGSTSNAYTIPVTSFPSHQLSNGLYVSGRPDQLKERMPTMNTAAAPYTGGDIKKSGELGKMFDIPVEPPKPKPSGSGGVSQGKTTGVILSRSHSGPLPSGAPRSAFSASGHLSAAATVTQNNKPAPQRCNSGPLTGSKSGPLITGPSGVPSKVSGPLSGGTTPNVLKTSGPLAPQLPATGLITSGPICSGPLASSRKACSGPLDSSASGKHLSGTAVNQAVNNLSNSKQYSFTRSFPRVILWTVIPLFVMGFIAGGFILAAVQNAILLIVVGTLFVALLVLLVWNTCWGSKVILGFVVNFPDVQLTNAKNGQYVKVTGVVTCGSVPLESSYQKVNRCIYTSTGLHEYRSSSSKAATANQRRFTWALRHLERRIVDFYISDFQSGLRALVKAGYGASVTPFVEESAVVDVTPKSRELPTDFLRWLTERNLSMEDRKMQLIEGYIKEGSTVTVLGVVQRHENVLMIVPPREPVSTGCQWGRFLLPAYSEGLIVKCEETSKFDGIPL